MEYDGPSLSDTSSIRSSRNYSESLVESESESLGSATQSSASYDRATGSGIEPIEEEDGLTEYAAPRASRAIELPFRHRSEPSDGAPFPDAHGSESEPPRPRAESKEYLYAYQNHSSALSGSNRFDASPLVAETSHRRRSHTQGQNHAFSPASTGSARHLIVRKHETRPTVTTDCAACGDRLDSVRFICCQCGESHAWVVDDNTKPPFEPRIASTTSVHQPQSTRPSRRCDSK